MDGSSEFFFQNSIGLWDAEEASLGVSNTIKAKVTRVEKPQACHARQCHWEESDLLTTPGVCVERTWLPRDSISTHLQQSVQRDICFPPPCLSAAALSSACPCSALRISNFTAVAHQIRAHTCKTKMLKRVFDPSLPSRCLAVSTSFSSSLTAYSRVVRVSSTSSTIRMFFPTRFDISSELRSSHCVRVTLVPGSSTGPPLPRSSYSDRPMA